MALRSSRSMYKTKLKEENTISTRRKSKELERRKNRDHELNKRRLISDMSLVVEEPGTKNVPHQKASTRLDRLKQWREERKRRIDTEMKQNKKPMFKVSNVKHSEGSELYRQEKVKNEIKLGLKNFKAPLQPDVKTSAPSNKQALKSIDLKKNMQPATSTIVSSVSTHTARSTRITRSSAKVSKKPEVQLIQNEAAKIVSKASSSEGKSISRSSRHKGQGDNQYTKLTASAAAKAKVNMDKPKEFLRAKSRSVVVTKSTTQSQKNTKQGKYAPQEKLVVEIRNEKVTSRKQGINTVSQESKINGAEAIMKEKETGNLSVSQETEVKGAVAKSEEETGSSSGSQESETKDTLAKIEENEQEESESSSVSQESEMKGAVAKIEEEETGSSSDSKELHLSDSGVVTPKHSTPFTTRHSSRKASSQYAINQEENLYQSGNKRRGKEASLRRSSRNLSAINASDVKAAMEVRSFKWSSSLANFDSSVAETDSDSDTANKGTTSTRNVFVFKGSSAGEVSGEESAAHKQYNTAKRENEASDVSPAVVQKEEMMEIIYSDSSMRNVLEKENISTKQSKSFRKNIEKSSNTLNSNHNDHEKEPIDTSVLEGESTEINPLEVSNKENMAEKDMDIRKKVLQKSASKLESLTNLDSVRKSKRSISVHHQPSDGQVTTPKEDITEPRLKYVSSASRRRSRRLIFSADEETQDETTFSPAKKLRQSATPYPTLNQADDTDDTQVVDIEPATPISRQRVRMGSALSKRKSARISALFISSKDCTTVESERSSSDINTTTPWSLKRRSTGKRKSSALRHSRRSTVVSVSHEGTTGIVGENIIEVTPKQDQKLVRSGTTIENPSISSKKARRSEIIDVSDEGTTLAEDLSSALIYHVEKPVDSETSSRALQELAVQKVDGETSFIEVPIDDNADTTECVSLSPKVETSTVSATDCNHQPVNEGVEDVTHMTEPFTPRRSSDMSKVTVSSSQSSPKSVNRSPVIPATPQSSHHDQSTPQSTCRRTRSMTPSSAFKTPGQPTSALRTKSEKRRKTEHSKTSKTPEQMIEILKKSPMIEMSRKRSRHISSPASTSVDCTTFDALTSSASKRHKSNTSAPELLLDLEPANKIQMSTSTTSLSGLTEALTLDPQVTERVIYFRDLLTTETCRLNTLCNRWNEISSCTPGLQEDVLGQIRSTVGKAQLLIDQRFKQFSGLVDNCEFSIGEKETTPTDLQGFWDMIYFQVEDVYQLFDKLSELQQNNWQLKQPSPAKEMLKPKKAAVKFSKPKVKSNFAAFREELLKRKAKETQRKASNSNQSDEDSETVKVFDAGFFKVASPVRSSSVTRLSGTPLKSASVDMDHVKDIDKPQSAQITPRPSGSDNKPSSPVGPNNKENELVCTPSNSRTMSMTAKRLSYLPVVPSPLLNDITGLKPKK